MLESVICTLFQHNYNYSLNYFLQRAIVMLVSYNYVYRPNASCPLSMPGGRNRSARRKPSTFGKVLTDSLHMSPKRESDPRSQRWKALALTTAPPKSQLKIIIRQIPVPISSVRMNQWKTCPKWELEFAY